ncbi:hypothetical protein J0B02_09890 [Enterobacteriaceae bacterium YMB-R22]|jgi:hypothetical protein|uniref:hypothetical protein n=1 Tax=Tenebrionicola larvae TaxID=2815733 RepID=UPI002012C671|nr:hypothetical protein [Tenebrionicola larvae]MBV4413120.1 hypothetical protein [Tenebrionicola larvae]
MSVKYYQKFIRIVLVIVSGGFIAFPSISFAEYPYPCLQNKEIKGIVHTFTEGWLALEGKYANACEITVNEKGENVHLLTLPVSQDYIAGQKLCSLAYNMALNKFSATFQYCVISKTGIGTPVYRLRAINFDFPASETGEKKFH